MALQMGALRDALLEAGSTPETAKAAAEEAAGYERRLSGMDSRLALLTWMVGGLYVAGASMFWMLLKIAANVGVIGQ